MGKILISIFIKNLQSTSGGFIINTINLQPGDPEIIVKRFKELFG